MSNFTPQLSPKVKGDYQIDERTKVYLDDDQNKI